MVSRDLTIPVKVLLPIGTAALATSAGFARYDIGEWWLAFGLFVLGLALLLVVAALVMIRAAWPREERKWRNYRCRKLLAIEVADIHTFLTKCFGQDIATAAQMQAWYAVRDDLFWILERGTKNGYQRVGFFELLPVKSGAKRGFEENSLTGTDLRAEHLAKKKGSAAALYVGSIVGTEHVAKAYAIRQLEVRIQKFKKNKGAINVYARPVTPDGYRLMNRHGFQSVIPNAPLEIGGVCMRPW
jgi:hypothetical protein